MAVNFINCLLCPVNYVRLREVSVHYDTIFETRVSTIFVPIVAVPYLYGI